MTYSLWSRGELLGESDLCYVRVNPKLRTGDLLVTPKGLTQFERLSQYRADAHHAARALNAKGTVDESDTRTLRADLAAQRDQYDVLALELRAPDGSVIATEEIFITDKEYLLSIGREAAEEDEAANDHSLDKPPHRDDLETLEVELREFEGEKPWSQEPEVEFVRFQLSVMLENEWAIP